MKKIIILTTLLAMLTAQNSSAKIWRINNTGIPASFTNLQAAHDAGTVLAGDTLHLEPSAVSYGDLVSTKKLIILGPGFFLNENANQQANPATAITASVTFNAGSSGSVISGLTVGAIYVNTGNITISRNNLGNSNIYLTRDYSYSGVVISGNYGIQFIAEFGSLSTTTITNVLILNNYLDRILLGTQFLGVMGNNILANYNSTI